jgi:hypothetical protein
MELNENIKALIESTKYSDLSASDKSMMGLMLENTEKENARAINEGTLSGDVAQFTPILMPMVRRVYPNLVANELLGVQPMAMPTGFIYALTNQYTGTGANKISPLATSNGLTGAILVVADLTGATVGGAISATADDSIANPVETGLGVVVYTEPVDAGDLTKGGKVLISITSGAFLTGDVVAYAATVAQSAGIAVTARYTNEASFAQVLKNYTGSVTTAQAELLGTDMKEVGFSISKKAVEAKSRALKGQYSVEMYQDLKAQHGLLADEEIMSLMSYEMQAEIDREIVDFVNTNATVVPNSSNISFSGAVDSAGRWEIEKYRTEVIKISKESQQIGIDTKRGQGNVLIVSPKVITMLEQVGSFKIATQNSGVTAPISGGVAGTFDSKFKVIVDQFANTDYATVLYKGADRRDSMGFFAPYVPLSFTKVTNFDSAQPAIVAKTRYALATIPGVESATSTDRARKYARSFGIDFSNSALA